MTDRELMQQALEVAENNLQVMKDDWQQIDQEWGPSQGGLQAAIDGTLTGYEYFKDTISAITALRERLAQPEREPFCFHDGRNIVGKEYADHSDVFPLYTSPNPEQQKPVRFNCTVIDDAHLNGVPLSQWGKQHEMQPCAGRNCGSTNPNLHSAECFEDYEKSTGMNQWQGLTDEERNNLWREVVGWGDPSHDDEDLMKAIEAKLREKNT